MQGNEKDLIVLVEFLLCAISGLLVILIILSSILIIVLLWRLLLVLVLTMDMDPPTLFGCHGASALLSP